jgi:hypothetical protein
MCRLAWSLVLSWLLTVLTVERLMEVKRLTTNPEKYKKSQQTTPGKWAFYQSRLGIREREQKRHHYVCKRMTDGVCPLI